MVGSAGVKVILMLEELGRGHPPALCKNTELEKDKVSILWLLLG